MAKTQTRQDVTPDEIRELLAYNPDTGEIFWKERPLKFFHDSGGRYTAERAKKIFDSQFAGRPALNCLNLNGYARGNLFRRLMLAHRAAFAFMTGRWPVQVDHINGVRHDNRWCNLREVTNQQNQQNTSSAKNSTSKYLGVSFDTKARKWAAYICPEGRKIHIGYFSTEDQAARARDDKAKQVFGEYARLNFSETCYD